MSVDMNALRQRLTGSLAQDGEFTKGWMREAFERVARHDFAPDTVWTWDSSVSGWVSVSRDDDPECWAGLVYANDSLVTQVDDGRTEPGAVGQAPTSSVSSPGAVLNMLAWLDPQPDDQVLEVGTGSGYNAALLCERAGDRFVTSVEIDSTLLCRAMRRLQNAGYRPHVVLGDGEEGWPASAPYDRLISTASVRRVPPAWLKQVRPGGEIVTPWFPNAHGRGLIWLRLGENGTARGWFRGGEAFMPVRGQRTTAPDVGRVWADTHHRAERVPSAPDLSDIDAHGEFALSVRLPGVGIYQQENDGWFLLSEDGRSWAQISGGTGHRYGPRDLLAEASVAAAWWREHGCPQLFDFGVTITKEQQKIWLREPGAVVAAK